MIIAPAANLRKIHAGIHRKEPPVQQIVGVTELQRRFRQFFDLVVRKRTPLVLTRGLRR